MAGYSAFGTVLEVSAVPIAELTNISGPSWSVDTIDVSSHDSADAHREYVAGLIDAGEVSIEGNVTTNAEFKALLDLLVSRTEDSFTIKYPTGTVNDLDFDGVMTALNPGAPHDGKLGFNASIKVSGKVTLAT